MTHVNLFSIWPQYLATDPSFSCTNVASQEMDEVIKSSAGTREPRYVCAYVKVSMVYYTEVYS